MPVYNMITGLNAEAGEGGAAIEGFGLVLNEGYQGEVIDATATVGVEDGPYFKAVFVRGESNPGNGRSGKRVLLPVTVSAPYCISLRTMSMAGSGGGEPFIGYSDLTWNGQSGIQFSADYSQVRRVFGGNNFDVGPWVDVPASATWRPSEPNTLEFSVDAELNVAVFLNGQELPDLAWSAPGSGGNTHFGIGFGREASGTYLSMGQIVISGAPLLAYDIPVLRPSADRTSVGFAPDTGTEMFSRINETVPDGDTSYVSASYGGDNALFRYTDADGNALALDPAQTVKAIKHTTQAKLDEAGNRELASVYQDGGNAEVTAGSVGVTGEYALRSQIIEVNPLTGVAWQPDDFADWSFGFQIVEE